MKSTRDQGEGYSSKRCCVGGEFYPPEGESVVKNALRLSFGVTSEDLIEVGVKGLNRALGDVRKT